jgi:hypothetical protein
MGLYIVSCYLMFKLGAFHQRQPGELSRYRQLAWQWILHNLFKF